HDVSRGVRGRVGPPPDIFFAEQLQTADNAGKVFVKTRRTVTGQQGGDRCFSRGFRGDAHFRLLSVDGERQQHIARHSTGVHVTRIRKQHSTGNRGAWSVERSAASGNAIDRLI